MSRLILKLKNIHPLKWLWFFLEQRNFTPTAPGNLFTTWSLAAIMSDAKRFPERNANLCRMVDFFGILDDFDNLGLFPLNDFCLFNHSSFSFSCAWILASNLLLNSELTSIKNKYLKIKRLFLLILFSHNKLRHKNLWARQAIAKISFVLHSTYTGDTPHRVWFDLNNSLIR